MQQAEPTKKKRNLSGKHLFAVLKEKVSPIFLHISKAVTLVKQRVVQAAVPSTDTKLFRTYAVLTLRVVFGFLMGYARLSQDIHPFGIAALCAFSDRQGVFFTYLGVAASTFFSPRTALSSFIIYFTLYAARKAFTESKFSEPLYVRILESTACAMVIGVVRLLAGGAEHAESPLYSYVAFVTLALLAGAFTYFFTQVFSPRLWAEAKMSTRSICSYALLAALTLSLDGVYVFGFDVKLIFASCLTLGFAAANGFMHAALLGFICGMVCGSPYMSAAMGFGGMAAAFLFSKGIVAALVAFAGVFFACLSYGASLEIALAALPSVLGACVAFIPACGFLPDRLRLFAVPSQTQKQPITLPENITDKRLHEALFSLSDVFAKLAQKKRYPNMDDVSLAMDKCFGDVCAHCALSEMCYARRKTDQKELVQTLHAVLSSRSAVPEDFGTHLTDKCIRLDELCSTLNTAYRALAVKHAEDNRSALLSAQYAGMAHLFLDAQTRKTAEEGRDPALEKNVAEALKKAGIPFVYIVSHGGRQKKTRVYGTSLDKFPMNAEEFKRYIFAECGIKITDPSFDLSEKNGVILEFSRAPAVLFEYASQGAAKTSDEVSGDAVSFFESDTKNFFALLCDGMGSGISAATASRLSMLFLEKMLAAGVKKSVALELLNNALLAQSGEYFSTVDILDADMFTGRCMFVKAGAAPTYILRTGKLYRIFSQTPPVGILSAFSAESTRFDVEPGDLIIMLSDGAVRDGEDNAWLAELIRLDKTGDPAKLACLILEKAGEINDRKDDITAAVIRVKKA